MARVSAKLRRVSHGFGHWCPGCEEMHVIYTRPTRPGGPVWSFDDNLDCPTFGPSVRIRTGVSESDPSYECCHYFLKGGQLQFCGDSTHELAGKSVPLPDLPPHLSD